MLDARRRNVLQRLGALTGAPLVVLGWGSALTAATSLTSAPTLPFDALPSAIALGTWWGLVALGIALHLGARLGLRRAAATDTDTDAGGATDEGLPLRRAVGSVALGAGLGLLALVGDVLVAGRAAPEVYATLDAALGSMSGVGVACFVGAASGLYVAEELPRAAGVLGLGERGAALRAAQVTSILLGAILFAASMNLVSHFSVGHALGGAPSGSAS